MDWDPLEDHYYRSIDIFFKIIGNKKSNIGNFSLSFKGNESNIQCAGIKAILVYI